MDPRPANIKQGCLVVLRYFGIFKYPLTLEEIHRFNGFPASVEETGQALDDLVIENRAYRAGDYFMENDDPGWVEERFSGNERALHLLARSGRFCDIVASFPFVRGVAISGSLSKFYASNNPDIDYFIITAGNRLWIARTLLHLFKKLTFITGHQHYFCMNYFVDTEALEITHPNLYTAIEVATLLPVYEEAVIWQFYRENPWVKEYLPNHPGPVIPVYLLKQKKRRFKRLWEGFFELLGPGKMNRALMTLTDRKWRRKWNRQGYPAEEYDRAFLTSLHISKNHPVDYEKKVLASLADGKGDNYNPA